MTQHDSTIQRTIHARDAAEILADAMEKGDLAGIAKDLRKIRTALENARHEMVKQRAEIQRLRKERAHLQKELDYQTWGGPEEE